MRMARQQLAAAVEQADRAVRSERNGGEELLDAVQLDRGGHQPDEFAVRPGDPPCELDDPGSGGAILYRLAQIGGRPPALPQHVEEVAVRHVDRRDWPRPGEVEDLALRVDQREGADMRQADDLVLENGRSATP